jgi:hypothetical protein
MNVWLDWKINLSERAKIALNKTTVRLQVKGV